MMSKKNIKTLIQVASFLSLCLTACNISPDKADISKISHKTEQNAPVSKNKYKVTFIELGSIKCIPCKQMQKVIQSVEEKYGSQVKIIFHDILTKEGKPYADMYKINSIPVQIFFNEKGEEVYRHEGYLPEEEVVKVLQINGVTEQFLNKSDH